MPKHLRPLFFAKLCYVICFYKKLCFDNAGDFKKEEARERRERAAATFQLQESP